MKKTLKKAIAVFITALIFISSFTFVGFAGNEFTYKKGDLNEDGRLSAADARCALRFSVELDVYTRAHLIIGDMNGDGKFTAADARKILRLTVHLDKNNYDDVKVTISQFSEFINKNQDTGNNTPAAPDVNAPKGSFVFTVYGWGHGVGLTQYGAIELDKAGDPFNAILSHYYTGTEIKKLTGYPEVINYPGLGDVPTQELVARIVYMEIYGCSDEGARKEAIKAQAVAIFTLLYYYDFTVTNKWSVGIASSKTYEELPESFRQTVAEAEGLYITEQGSDKTEPILSVYGASAAGLTASAESVWGSHYSYLIPVVSYCNPNEKGFVTQVTYTAAELKKLITAYDSSIILSDDPSQWLMIREHTSSIDEQRGYVVSIDVGNKRLHGNNDFVEGILGGGLRSSCFTVSYIP